MFRPLDAVFMTYLDLPIECLLPLNYSKWRLNPLASPWTFLFFFPPVHSRNFTYRTHVLPNHSQWSDMIYRWYACPFSSMEDSILTRVRSFWSRDIVVGIAVRYGLDRRGSNPSGCEIFRTCSDRRLDPPSLPYNRYWVFSGIKAAGSWRRSPDPIWRQG